MHLFLVILYWQPCPHIPFEHLWSCEISGVIIVFTFQLNFDVYRPQRSCWKVLFLQGCVKNSVHTGVCIPAYTGTDIPQAATPLGRHLPGRYAPTDTPQADTPLPGQTSPPWAEAPLPGRTLLSPVRPHLSTGRHPPGRYPHPLQRTIRIPKATVQRPLQETTNIPQHAHIF